MTVTPSDAQRLHKGNAESRRDWVPCGGTSAEPGPWIPTLQETAQSQVMGFCLVIWGGDTSSSFPSGQTPNKIEGSTISHTIALGLSPDPSQTHLKGKAPKISFSKQL